MREIEQLYFAYKRDVYNYLLSLTHDPPLSEDLLSETFLQAIRALPAFRGDASVKTWLISIARRLWLQHLRKQKTMPGDDALLAGYLQDSPSQIILTRELKARIEQLLSQRDARSRGIAKMRMDGEPYAKIAESFSISESSARVIDFRLKKWLREQLGKEGLL